MGFFSDFFGRGTRVVRGQLNQGMDTVEDATFEATLKQTVRDMKTELNQLVRTSAEAMSNHNRLESEYQKHLRQSEEWKERAMKAVEAGREDLARKALSQKAECDGQVESMQATVDSARAASDKLKQRMQELKTKISDAERNASTLIARRNAAQAQKKVAKALAGVSDAENAFSALSAFEESVAQDEAEAQAFDDMAGATSSDLEAEFASLDTPSLDDELAALKKEMKSA